MENGTTVFIDACDFAVQKGVLNPKILSDPVGQVLEAAKGVSVSRDEATLTGFDKARRTIPIDLEFEQIIVGVERFRTARKPQDRLADLRALRRTNIQKSITRLEYLRGAPIVDVQCRYFAYARQVSFAIQRVKCRRM